MPKQQITPEGSAEIMGAYSHGLKVDIGDSEMIFVTGQIAQDSEGNVVSDDIEEQTEYVFQQIQNILNEASASLDDVVKAQIFLTDINDFAKVSPIRNKYFTGSKPVSTLVEVSNLVKQGCKIEIEVIAIKGK
ncbi:RidA family protein [Candidatus Saccharibacteria bacterium]|nr:RidA family protein [Candidatus Saccharibacteria bacterium]